ncbi:uncharacterized protein MKZ38_003203 [Zalerion maritima]|uniref:NADH dehydrogenase [ubiquinone] 1 alpha subcomplex subunit 5 n=1 Tax=Zalerion maritima TaxID=339359 RepID=A0AAD5S044_9PEZI|nr:uncharacterized protein MKZ38_003203 [Zalerion maritima]
MRPALRMFAMAKPSAAAASKFIEPGLPTGLTGLHSQQSPRSSLLYLYNTALEKLKQVPEASLYRQSVENLTKHRLSVVESVVPQGWESWAEKTSKILEEHKDKFTGGKVFTINGARAQVFEKGGRLFICKQSQHPMLFDEDEVEWDGEGDEGGELEGSRTEEERKEQILLAERKDRLDGDVPGWEAEPQLTRDQVTEIEEKIGSGLIEELIEVAEGELKLADVMIQSKAWEDLAEKPAEGQWTYFDRTA